MITTPKELQEWNDEVKNFTVIDVRPEVQRIEFPLNGLNTVVSNENEINLIEGTKVLVCQFGIVTERMIIENDLEDTYSLLGGAQAWIEFQNEQFDLDDMTLNDNSLDSKSINEGCDPG